MTRKSDYALVAMAHLASAGSERVSARGIAERLGLPVPALMNILNQLGHAGLVTSTRGPNGGYGLARAPSEISLASLIEAVEGPVKLALCCNEVVDMVERRCEIESACAIKEPVKKVHSMLRRFLSEVTLDHIATNRVPADLGVDLLNGVAGGKAVGAEKRDCSDGAVPAGQASRSE